MANFVLGSADRISCSFLTFQDSRDANYSRGKAFQLYLQDRAGRLLQSFAEILHREQGTPFSFFPRKLVGPYPVASARHRRFWSRSELPWLGDTPCSLAAWLNKPGKMQSPLLFDSSGYVLISFPELNVNEV